MTSLRECLTDWTEIDVAMFHVASSLGILGPDVKFLMEAKGVFWSSNRLCDALDDVLKVLVELGAVEFDEDEQSYRWNREFVWRDISRQRGR